MFTERSERWYHMDRWMVSGSRDPRSLMNNKGYRYTVMRASYRQIPDSQVSLGGQSCGEIIVRGIRQIIYAGKRNLCKLCAQ